MFFKDYLSATADIIDAKFRGHRWQGQNSADIGEVCETFVNEFINQFLSNQFSIFRGGNIVSVVGKKSDQMDIVLCSKSCPVLFTNKGLYPIEAVLGAFAVTSNLTPAKLVGSVNCLASIPDENPRFYYIAPWRGTVEPDADMIKTWKRRVPYRCIFGVNGVLDSDSVAELNEAVAENRYALERMPDIIVVNRRGMILKNRSDLLVEGKPVEGHFYFTDVQAEPRSWMPLAHIINDLAQVSALWGGCILPKYNEYFEADMTT
jgi:hypothetical protein